MSDPQNPVHFVPNAELVTNKDPKSLAFGLAPIISDGPTPQGYGVFSAVRATTTPRRVPNVANPKTTVKPPGVVTVGIGPFP
jgi:hypothetical protein